jgi:hypothetical protein
MRFELDRAVPVLERTPGVLRALLAGLPDEWTRATEGPETWSPFDVVGHLVHGERTDWLPRVEIMLRDGESRAVRSVRHVRGVAGADTRRAARRIRLAA